MDIETILQNIKSLVEEAESLKNAKPSDEPAPTATDGEGGINVDDLRKALKALIEDDEEGKDDDVSKKVDKDEGTNEGEGSDASDSAEDRIDDQPDMNEVQEITKSLAKLLLKKNAGKTVTKSKESEELKKIREELAVQKEFTTNVLKGLGIAEKIEALQAADKKPVVNSDVNKTLDFIKQLAEASSTVKKEEPVKPVWGAPSEHSIQKDLGDEKILKGLWGV